VCIMWCSCGFQADEHTLRLRMLLGVKRTARQELLECQHRLKQFSVYAARGGVCLLRVERAVPHVVAPYAVCLVEV
jgi:hypothetical protein